MNGKSILLVGSPRDPTFGHTITALHRQGRELKILDIDRFYRSGNIDGTLNDPHSLVLQDSASTVHLDEFLSCYARFIDLPTDWTEGDIKGNAVTQGRFRILQLVVAALQYLVVNRPGVGESNDSKPYQTALLRRHGFCVPRSCSTNLEDAASHFVQSCPRGAVYKSNSGQRSIVQAVTADDVGRFSLLASCPVFFQERVWGTDLRVHVVRDRCHGVLIRSPAVDYRYDRSGEATEKPVKVPEDLAERCISVTAALGLEFSGIDLIHSDDDNAYYCLEVNPMPGYHGYDLTLDYAISDSLGELLSTG